jgi:hypothetical protein
MKTKCGDGCPGCEICQPPDEVIGFRWTLLGALAAATFCAGIVYAVVVCSYGRALVWM